ncbi:MAG TPA: TadE/TadG family type IV pilus assembly protein [Sphingomicrobium sp.]|nr:TadE/TadG family type IV pilus assembly protein [Sphingomicrobium sp.]
MTRFRKLCSDQSGSAAIEFIVAVPVLVSMLWGIFQFAVLLQANAGMQHALGEAARYATVYPTPSDTQIQAKITSSKFGVGSGTWDTPVITTDSTTQTKTLTVTYHQPLDFLFLPGPTVDLTANKVVYLAT